VLRVGWDVPIEKPRPSKPRWRPLRDAARGGGPPGAPWRSLWRLPGRIRHRKRGGFDCKLGCRQPPRWSRALHAKPLYIPTVRRSPARARSGGEATAARVFAREAQAEKPCLCNTLSHPVPLIAESMRASHWKICWFERGEDQVRRWGCSKNRS